ncbi:UNVERIFIED_CONTAM: lysophospholipase L1-like esterase [Brevibacillus sp. OAP136]
MRTSGQFLWRFTGALALLSFLVLAAGFAFALNPQMAAPGNVTPAVPGANGTTTPAAPPVIPSGKLNMVTLGDSLTRGVGDANGQGYVGLVRDALAKKTGQAPMLTNFAISGQQSNALLEQLELTQVRALLPQANLILFTIGGNDLFQQSGELDVLDEKKLAQARESLAANFKSIVMKIRMLNPNATVVYLSLYNPFGNTQAAKETIRPVLDWNAEAERIAASFPNVLVVPTYDLFVKKEANYLYTDHFHPNAKGYTRMAERVVRALE